MEGFRIIVIIVMSMYILKVIFMYDLKVDYEFNRYGEMLRF